MFCLTYSRLTTIALALTLCLTPLFGGGRSAAGTIPAAPVSVSEQALLSIGIRPVDAQTPAADLDFRLLGGEATRLSAYRGSLVLVNVWATWCEPCRLEMPSMEWLHREFRHRGLVVLALNYAESEELVTAYIEAEGYSFPVGFDPRREISDRLGVRGLPTNYLIGPHGRVIGTKVGFRFWDTPEVFEAFDLLLESEWTHQQSD